MAFKVNSNTKPLKHHNDTVDELRCGVCQDAYSISQLFHCKIAECVEDKRMYCHECAQFIHKKKSHQFGNIYDVISECEEKHVEHTSAELQSFEIQCEGLCDRKYIPTKLYQCQHTDCKTKKILCSQCGYWSHQSKSHPFIIRAEYIKSLQDIIKPDATEYSIGRKIGNLTVKQWKLMQQIIWNQRWHGIESTAALATNFATTVGVTATCSSFVTCASSLTSNAPIGSGIATALEWAYIWYRYRNGRIRGKEALSLGATALAASASSTATLFQCAAWTDPLIRSNAIGPYTAIGLSVIGAVIVGFSVRGCMDQCWQKWFGDDDEKTRNKLQREALQFFFGDVNYDIDDGRKFNENILRRRYRRLSLIVHPDRKDGDEREWLKLCAHYGILTAVCEYKMTNSHNSHTTSKDQIRINHK